MTRKRFKQILQQYYSTSPPCKYVLAVDFDNTLCNSSFPDCGSETPICDFIRSIQDLDYIQILTTCRDGNISEINALDWCAEHNIRVDFCNQNDPRRIKYYEDCRKIFCNMLIDDTAYNFNMDDFIKD